MEKIDSDGTSKDDPYSAWDISLGYFMAGFAAGLVMEFGNQMFAS
jgi:hypothetical protein